METVHGAGEGSVAIVGERVKPERAHLTNNAIGRKRARFRWQYGLLAKGLYAAVEGLDRVLVVSRVGRQAAFSFLPKGMVYAEPMIVFPFDTRAAFCTPQSRPHEICARLFDPSLGTNLAIPPPTSSNPSPSPRAGKPILP